MNELRKKWNDNRTMLVEVFQDIVTESQKTGIVDLTNLLTEFSKVVAKDHQSLMEFEIRNKIKLGMTHDLILNLNSNRTRLVEVFQNLIRESQKTKYIDLSNLTTEFSKIVAKDDEAFMQFEAMSKKKKGFF